MEQGKIMCKIVQPYTCPNCGNDLLFFTTPRNIKSIYYKELYENSANKDQLMKALLQENIEGMKCLSCKHVYLIDNTGEYPKPLTDKNVFRKFGCKV